MAESTDTPPVVCDTQPAVAAVHNELLCYLQSKSSLMTYDHLVKLVTDFYSKDEVFSARLTVERYLPSRLPRRQGPNSTRVTVEDILKMILNPEVKLPVFYATALDRLPPVDASHCDVSAILKELQVLRAEVRVAADLRQEVVSMSSDMAKMKAEIDDMRVKLTSAVDDMWPAVSASSNIETNSQTVPVLSSAKSFSKHAQSLQTDSGTINKKPPRKPVIGKSKDRKLTSVVTSRTVELFISRLHPHTSCNEVKECADSIVQADNIVPLEIQCQSLKPKVEGLYASFHVSLRVGSADLSHAITLLMNADLWPAGVFVKRYYKPKDGSEQS